MHKIKTSGIKFKKLPTTTYIKKKKNIEIY